ncbi:MAG: hypothetical protein OES57_13290 [Acidimicrobiia bacterium]|nr:hypothetical protein [Acidimicrobiia bacterium]
MRISIDAHTGTPDELPDDWEEDGLALLAWSVAISDDYSDFEPRVALTVEEVGRSGQGLTLPMSPAVVRHLRATLATALAQIGEAAD